MDLILDIYVLIIFISKFCVYDLLFYYTCNIELNNISTLIFSFLCTYCLWFHAIYMSFSCELIKCQVIQIFLIN